jgi:hypothetical protein
MLQKSAIIEVRQRLGIPGEGFPNEYEALAWYKDHYSHVKGKNFSGNFGFQYAYKSGLVDFEYDMGPDYIKIYAPHPLDEAVPLDSEALLLANKTNIPAWAAPAFRLVILVGALPEIIEIRVPSHLTSPLGSLRVLVHPAEEVSLRTWRKIGQMLGLLTGKGREGKTPWTTTTYSLKRESKKESLYLQTLWAYMAAIEQRGKRGQKGKRGLLVETAKILEANYGWDYVPDSYTIRRFLDRAEKIWHISTR